MKHDKYKTQLAEMRDSSAGYTEPAVAKLDKRALSKQLSRSGERIAKQERQLALLVKKKDAEPEKPELIIECLSEEKRIIDVLTGDLVLSVNSENMSMAKAVKEKMLVHLKRYNAFVAEYKQKTGAALTEAPYTIPDDIIGGRDYAVLPVLTYSREDISDDACKVESEANVISSKDFYKYASKNDRAIAPLVSKYDEILAKKENAHGKERVILILDALAVKKQLVESETEVVIAASRSTSTRDLREAKKILAGEVKDYNALVEEYESITGNKLTLASKTLPDDAAEGKEIKKLPIVTYTVKDPTVGGKQDKNYRNANKNVQNAVRNEEKLIDTSLENKIAEQANKDMLVMTGRADYRVSLLETERDMAEYRFGASPRPTKKRRKAITKEIAYIKNWHKEAIKLEQSDNKRYYEVVKTDPHEQKLGKKDSDRDKLASLRTKIITLLNARDEVNSELISIYTGQEISESGVSVNQQWRRIKLAAADRVISGDKKIAKKVERLPATPAEKQRIYAAMNRKLDAESNIALIRHRLKKERLSKQEAKDLRTDLDRQRKISHQAAEDVNWMCDRIQRRYSSDKNPASGWLVSLLLIILLVGGGVGVILWLYGPQLLALLG